jgi:hypothetical protein
VGASLLAKASTQLTRRTGESRVIRHDNALANADAH